MQDALFPGEETAEVQTHRTKQFATGISFVYERFRCKRKSPASLGGRVVPELHGNKGMIGTIGF
jgi:hypothetical protein